MHRHKKIDVLHAKKNIPLLSTRKASPVRMTVEQNSVVCVTALNQETPRVLEKTREIVVYPAPPHCATKAMAKTAYITAATVKNALA